MRPAVSLSEMNSAAQQPKGHWGRLWAGLGGAAIAGTVAGVGSVIGAQDQATWKLAVVSGLLAIVGFFVAAAISASGTNRAPWLGGACVVFAGLAAFTYWQLRRPAPFLPTVAYTVNGSEVQELRAHGEPGGAALVIAPSIYGSNTYRFDCQAVVGPPGERSIWLRLAGSEYWYPLTGVHLPAGVHSGQLPMCD